MGFDRWSLREKIVMVWALAIATVAIIFVCVSLGSLISENSSNIASWVQAIGSIGAIIGVWWQTNAQFAADKFSQEEERAKKAEATLKRSIFLIDQFRMACVDIKVFSEKYKSQQRLYIQNLAFAQSNPGRRINTDDLAAPNPGWEQYRDVLSSALMNFSNLPYWEIENTDLANNLILIHNSAKRCLLSIEYDALSFHRNLDSLMENMDLVEKLIGTFD